METYAGTASRVDQRIIDSISVLDPSWDEFSLDVGKAFAKGMTFAELSELTGQPMRAVEFQVNGEDLEILRDIPGFEDYDPNEEVLSMEKPIYGLKDAPRAWRVKLDRVLRSWRYDKRSSGLKPLKAAPEIDAAHDDEDEEVTGPNAIDKMVLAEAVQGGEVELAVSYEVKPSTFATREGTVALTKRAQEEAWRM